MGLHSHQIWARFESWPTILCEDSPPKDGLAHSSEREEVRVPRLLELEAHTEYWKGLLRLSSSTDKRSSRLGTFLGSSAATAGGPAVPAAGRSRLPSSFCTDVVLVASPSFGFPICKTRVTTAPLPVPQDCPEAKVTIRTEILAGVLGVSARELSINMGRGQGAGFWGSTLLGFWRNGRERTAGALARTWAASPAQGKLSTSFHLLCWKRNQGGCPAPSRGQPCAGTRKQVGQVALPPNQHPSPPCPTHRLWIGWCSTSVWFRATGRDAVAAIYTEPTVPGKCSLGPKMQFAEWAPHLTDEGAEAQRF